MSKAPRRSREALKAETERLRRQLIDTAARVQHLERAKVRLDAQIAVLSKREGKLAKSFAHDRVAVAHLLGLLERLQHDMPPVLALTSDDALSGARSAMLLGASLPRVYGAGRRAGQTAGDAAPDARAAGGAPGRKRAQCRPARRGPHPPRSTSRDQAGRSRYRGGAL